MFTSVSILLALFFSLMVSYNPLLMSINILFSALIMTYLFSSIFSSWYAFMIFLIYIGGMMVMFTYFTAMSPNQNMNLTNNLKLIMLLLSLILISTFMLKFDPPSFFKLTFNSQGFYSASKVITLMMLINLLLLSMVLIVKIINLSKGPFRPFNYV
uniref:NADH dehydrogenase subunit 6 n=1 Tax=Paracanthobdella livanowi TaxID=2905687 RepID=A0A9E8JY90_9ANNE|nr:NADH dehydrogenase subunit 6 [Paracanthobdella livanowi]UZT67763.1 NADH dehydrogenase subunit 6 [Paracanthobdella livanowi]